MRAACWLATLCLTCFGLRAAGDGGSRPAHVVFVVGQVTVDGRRVMPGASVDPGAGISVPCGACVRIVLGDGRRVLIARTRPGTEEIRLRPEEASAGPGLGATVLSGARLCLDALRPTARPGKRFEIPARRTVTSIRG